MAAATLTIDLEAIQANWRALDGLSGPKVHTAAVVKAFGYGLDSGIVAKALADTGAQNFFVADVSEAAHVYSAIGQLKPKIFVFSGLMAGDERTYHDTDFIPMLNSLKQVERFLSALPNRAFGLQIDTGMNRLGLEPSDLAKARAMLAGKTPALVMSHLACADEPDHPMNARQLAQFKHLTDGWNVPRSLSATGGTLLGPEYHFDMNRPGVGLYGGLPFQTAKPVVQISIPVIQTRHVAVGESVGYGNNWIAQRPSRIATLAAGYADGLIRAMGHDLRVWNGAASCPVVGRVSMDMLTIDVTDLANVPDQFDILGPHQNVDELAEAAGTIGYEILTSLGARYKRVYKGG